MRLTGVGWACLAALVGLSKGIWGHFVVSSLSRNLLNQPPCAARPPSGLARGSPILATPDQKNRMCLAWESSIFERKPVFSVTTTSRKAPHEHGEGRFLLRDTVFQAKHVQKIGGKSLDIVCLARLDYLGEHHHLHMIFRGKETP